ncbi:tetraacyldisaccharide 4'-kinase [Paraglaciecola hydrolytica]|uniref:Tetraacyldisaccharide 4'-kinase n=1 Tax=Paraglaciecola hydrolytica TaxID=1799789 RepID=A0A136A1A3_9ALTE|nr:tetraacyldisaccharide 4'-kinase [Paraglaciecola hydrolytica]KXI28983.1 tetraacyldisaccharide 4'-kinase [Paraglaciecola hydrolytica]
MFSLSQLWYAPRWYHWCVIILLLPLSLLFMLLASGRRQAFKLGFKKSNKVNAFVIIVGNISVGGNGKTPLVVYLAQLLTEQGYKPGVLTRGYGGKSVDYPVLVDENSQAAVVGDEPLLMRQHIFCPIVIDPIRSQGAAYLVKQCHCDVIICDDGLQHYALQRDIEIVVMDGQRRLGNHLLLPAGPLREGKWRLNTVDFIVTNGEHVENGEYAMGLQPGNLINVKNPNRHCGICDITEPVTALAGIGNPQRFFSLLATYQLNIKQQLSFVDHHAFKASDLPTGTVLMTEKDAVKCRDFAHDDCWYLPVKATLAETFNRALLAKLQLLKANKTD